MPGLSRRHQRDGALQLGRVGRLTYPLLILVMLLSIFPLYWTGVVASQSNDAIGRTPPPLVPGGNLFDNIRRVFEQTNFRTALVNSLVVASAITVSVLVFCSLAGFAFAKLRFRGRQAMMLIVVSTMMVPTQLGVIPLYIMIGELGWSGRLPAVVVPAMVTRSACSGCVSSSARLCRTR